MRALLVCALALSGGCSLIFDGKDLRGTGGQGDGGTDMSGSVDGSTDLADSDGSAGADGGDGGASCTVMIGDAGMGHTVTEVPTGGSTSISIGLADFNMDGKPDIVAANEVSSNLSLLINDGAGKFTLAVQSPFTTCAEPASMVVVDADKNGKPDVVVGCYSSTATVPMTAVWLHLGKGDGTFYTPTPLGVAGVKPIDMRTGDFNGDTNPDVVVVYENSKTAVILTGNGLGGFTSGTPIPLTAIDPDGVGVGNWNGDGKTDFAVTDYSNGTVEVFLSDTGGFVARPAITGLGFVGAPVSFDVNGDQLEDLVVPQGYTKAYLSVFRNMGAGVFPTTATNDFIADETGAIAAVGDFNCDGKPDVAMTSFETGGRGRVIVMRNEGGAFAQRGSAVVDYTNNIAVADLNADGIADSVVSQRGAPGSVTVVLTHY